MSGPVPANRLRPALVGSVLALAAARGRHGPRAGVRIAVVEPHLRDVPGERDARAVDPGVHRQQRHRLVRPRGVHGHRRLHHGTRHDPRRHQGRAAARASIGRSRPRTWACCPRSPCRPWSRSSWPPIFGGAIIRMTESTMAMATLALLVVVHTFLQNATTFTRGSLGLAGIPVRTTLGVADGRRGRVRVPGQALQGIRAGAAPAGHQGGSPCRRPRSASTSCGPATAAGC